MLKRNLIKYQEKLFWEYRSVNPEHINPDKIQDLKEFWHCDIVLKQKTSQSEVLMFLREIPEVEIEN